MLLYNRKLVIPEPSQIFLAVNHHVDLHLPSEIADHVGGACQSPVRFRWAAEDVAIELARHFFRRLVTKPLVVKFVGLHHPHQLNASREPAFPEIGHQATKDLALRLACEEITIKLLYHGLRAGFLQAYRHSRSFLTML